jgi:branched-chain amino acid aminotransferase
MLTSAAVDELIWFDGGLRAASDAAIGPLTHALHYGSAVFEGIRAYETPRGSAVFLLREHVERLFASAAVYELSIPYSAGELCEAIRATLRANDFAAGYIRPLAFYGQKGISLSPRDHCPTHVLIALRPLSGSLIGSDPGGCRVTISPFRKTPSRSMPSTAKASGHYMNSILALQHAVARGFDEALLLNDRGEIAEGSGENVFLVRDGRLYTNDREADVLMGLTRWSVMQLAAEMGLRTTVGPLRVEDLATADEAFFTGTAAEIMPIACVDALVFPSNRPVTHALQSAYRAVTRGEVARHDDWLTYV